MRTRFLFALAASTLAWTPAPRAAEPVDVALVLVTDVSRSIDDSEFALEKQGYAAAFTNPEVIAAIKSGANGSIAVNYVEFASSFETRTVIGWTVIRDEQSARAFATAIAAQPRSFYGRTAIGSGMQKGLENLNALEMEAQRRVIDVCGDGTNNNGPEVTQVRDAAIEAGVTINGLAIINDHPVSWTFAHVQPPGGLANYYRDNVTGGPGTFVVEIHDFHAFEQAITRKLINEIADVGTPRKS